MMTYLVKKKEVYSETQELSRQSGDGTFATITGLQEEHLLLLRTSLNF